MASRAAGLAGFLVLAGVLTLPGLGFAQSSVSVTVPGTSDPWLSGAPPGATASCGYDGSLGQYLCDTIPAEAPVLVPVALHSGTTLSFSASGSAGYGPTQAYQTGPGGSPSLPTCHQAGPENGVPEFCAPMNALVGVFVGSAGKLIFLIGSSNTVTVPAGMEQLFLGMMDGYGWWDNSGTFAVTISSMNGVPQTSPSVSCTVTPSTLWPPNGKPVEVTVSGTVTAGTQPIPADGTTYAVTDEYGQVQPSGSISLGTEGSYSFGVSLVASRYGIDRDGRTYTVAVSATDTVGNVGSCSVVVTVPHDQGKKK